MKKLLLLLAVVSISHFVNAQKSMGVGTTTPNQNAVLHLVSPTGDQGLLIPSYTTAERTAVSFTENLSDTDNGLLVFDREEGSFYFWYTDQWMTVSGAQGDMLKSLYDIDDDGIVDNAELVNGLTVETSVPTGAIFTDNQTSVDVVVTPSGNLTSSNVQSALEELQNEVSGSGDMLTAVYDQNLDGYSDTAAVANALNGYTIETSVPAGAVFTDAQTAGDVGVTPNGNLSSSDVQSALEELQNEVSGSGDMLTAVYDQNLDGYSDTAAVANSLNGYTIETSVPAGAVFTDAQIAGDVGVTPNGDLLSSDVQSALEELQNEVSGSGDMLTAVYDQNLDGYSDTAAVANSLNGYTIETSVPAGAVFIDAQTAGDVGVTPNGNLSSTDVQSALIELQTDIDVASTGGDMLQSVYDADANGSVNAADSLSINFIDGVTLAYSVAVPGIEVRNSGISTAKLADGAVTGSKIGITASEGNALVYTLGAWQAGQYSFSDLNNVPSGLIDGDDVGLTSVNTADIVNGAVTSDKLGISASSGEFLHFNGTSWVGVNESDPTWISDRITLGSVGTINNAGNLIDWSQLKNVPTDFSDGVDDIGLTVVNTTDIADDAITSLKIANGSVANEDLDKSNIPLSGFGNPTANVSVGGFKITNLGTPTAATDATNKSYVDSNISSITSSQWTTTGSDVNYASGNVGIGVDPPSEALDVIGNIEVSGDFKYSSGNEKIHYRTTPAGSFTERRFPGSDVDIVTDNSTTSYRYFYGGSPLTYAYADAAVYFPDNAVVTEVTAYLFNNDTVAFTVRGRLTRMDLATGNRISLATCEAPSTSPNIQAINAPSIVSAQIDNSLYAYSVVFEGRAHSGLTRIYAIRVRYTVAKPD
ncbi:MAG: hypothetical protein RIC35_00850 [Marinoscillum sp.]